MPDEALSRYFDILNGEERARYLLAKERLVDVDLDSDDGLLGSAHMDAMKSVPAHPSGTCSLLDLKEEISNRMLTECALCERRCGANRREGDKGHCGVLEARVSADFLHTGEEPELVPSYTIFFSGCTFNCVYCQNWDISTDPEAGASVDPKVLARKIGQMSCGEDSQGVRARNVNWVGGDPTSNLPFILDVLKICEENIPQVWNSNMYLTEESMALLDGVVDVFLSDFKYGNDRCALRLSNVRDYTNIVQRNHILARKSAEMIVRHLVLPGHLDCCTRPALEWIAENLRNVKVNVMGQYRPEHRARGFDDISRPLRMDEYAKALEIAEHLGLDLCE